MAELKTKPTGASVGEYLYRIDHPGHRADCAAVAALLQKVTNFEPVMWGPSIVGFGSYHYRYPSGHEGDACLIGFSFRKPEIVIYIAEEFESREELLQQLGPHRTGKVCLYIKRLADVDAAVLRKIAKASVAEVRRRYPSKPGRSSPRAARIREDKPVTPVRPSGRRVRERD